MAVKTETPLSLRMYLSLAGMTECTRHTIDAHWARWSESPTNIILFPLIFSSIDFASNLQNKQQQNFMLANGLHWITKSKNMLKDIWKV